MAEFYGSVAEADKYHLARGNTSWAAAVETDKTAALIRASSWLDGAYGNRFHGKKTGGRDQGLGWPRSGAADCNGDQIGSDSVPREIEHATYEAALRELSQPNSLSPDYNGSDQIKRERKKVGDMEREVEYADAAASITASQPVFSTIDGILSCLIGGRSNTSATFVGRA